MGRKRKDDKGFTGTYVRIGKWLIPERTGFTVVNQYGWLKDNYYMRYKALLEIDTDRAQAYLRQWLVKYIPGEELEEIADRPVVDSHTAVLVDELLGDKLIQGVATDMEKRGIDPSPAVRLAKQKMQERKGD